MEKVVRLTEQDLVRLVKKVLNEQANGGASWEKIVRACSNTFGTDLKLLKTACSEINNSQTYNEALTAAKKKNYQTIMSYIMGDFSTIFDSVKYSPASAGRGDYDADGWSKDNDTQTALFCDTQLRKFNPKEHEVFMDKVETPYG